MQNPQPQQIRDARLYAGHTQAAAAEFMNCSRRAWQDWEASVNPMPINTWELYLIKTKQNEPKQVDYENLVSEQVFSADQTSKAIQRSSVASQLNTIAAMLDDRNVQIASGEIEIKKVGNVFSIKSELKMVKNHGE